MAQKGYDVLTLEQRLKALERWGLSRKWRAEVSGDRLYVVHKQTAQRGEVTTAALLKSQITEREHAFGIDADNTRAERVAELVEIVRKIAAVPRKSPKERWWAPDRVFEMGLTPAQLAVFCFLCRRAKRSGVAWPGRQDIADACGIRPDTVSAALVRLEALNMITRKRRFNDSTIYHLVPHEEWTVSREEALSA